MTGSRYGAWVVVLAMCATGACSANPDDSKLVAPPATRCLLPVYDVCGECVYACVPDPPQLGQPVRPIVHACVAGDCREVVSVYPTGNNTSCYAPCSGHLVFPSCVRSGNTCETHWPEGAAER